MSEKENISASEDLTRDPNGAHEGGNASSPSTPKPRPAGVRSAKKNGERINVVDTAGGKVIPVVLIRADDISYFDMAPDEIGSALFEKDPGRVALIAVHQKADESVPSLSFRGMAIADFAGWHGLIPDDIDTLAVAISELDYPIDHVGHDCLLYGEHSKELDFETPIIKPTDIAIAPTVFGPGTWDDPFDEDKNKSRMISLSTDVNKDFIVQGPNHCGFYPGRPDFSWKKSHAYDGINYCYRVLPVDPACSIPEHNRKAAAFSLISSLCVLIYSLIPSELRNDPQDATGFFPWITLGRVRTSKAMMAFVFDKVGINEFYNDLSSLLFLACEVDRSWLDGEPKMQRIYDALRDLIVTFFDSIEIWENVMFFNDPRKRKTLFDVLAHAKTRATLAEEGNRIGIENFLDAHFEHNVPTSDLFIARDDVDDGGDDQ